LRVADRCAQLYADRVAPKIVFTGDRGNWTEQMFDEPEAEIFARRAQAQGVPAADLLIESTATNIGQNLQRTRDLLMRLGHAPASAIVVTKGNTLRRVRATVEKVWPDLALTLACPTCDWSQAPAQGWSRNALIHEMVGDLQRILIYPALGFQVTQSVPLETLAAYHLLVKLGFDQHLMSDQPLE
jgi:uncharacterized SAM-binding protein YcdF (DUF218 family)